MKISKSSKYLFVLLAFITLFVIPSWDSQANARKFSLGVASNYGFVIHGTPEENTIFQTLEFSIIGKYRPIRFVALRTSLGVQYIPELENMFYALNQVRPVFSAGGELHFTKISSVFDPYLFLETGYPRPVDGGLGIAIQFADRWAVFAEAQAGMQSWIKLKDYFLSTYNEDGFQASGKVGVLVRF